MGIKVGNLTYTVEMAFLSEDPKCRGIQGHGNCLGIRQQLYAVMKGWA